MKRSLGLEWAVLPVLVACGTDRGQQHERVGFDEASLDQGCRNADANATALGKVRYGSPETYSQSRCGKGIVVDVFQYLGGVGGAVGMAGIGGIAGTPTVWGGFGSISPSQEVGSTRVQWTGSTPNNQGDCESSWIASYVFERQTDPDAWTVLEFASAQGTWDGACSVPWVEFPASLFEVGGSYRFAASARPRPTSSAPTRRLGIVTK